MKKYISFLLISFVLLLSLSSYAQEKKADTVTNPVEQVGTALDGVNKNLVYVTDKLEAAITVMSQKLGVASDQVWKILVYKHTINGYFWLFVIAITLCAWIVTIKLYNFHSQKEGAWQVLKKQDDKCRYLDDYWENKAQVIVLMVVLMMTVIVLTGFAIALAYGGFMDLLRPEVGAMQDALDLLKGIVQ